MSSCKNKECESWDGYMDEICPFCGFCERCHRDSELEGSCASLLDTQKTEHFKFKASEPVPTYECIRCGAYKFIVGITDTYETSIKCPRCGFEKIVHDG